MLICIIPELSVISPDGTVVASVVVGVVVVGEGVVVSIVIVVAAEI